MLYATLPLKSILIAVTTSRFMAVTFHDILTQVELMSSKYFRTQMTNIGSDFFQFESF